MKERLTYASLIFLLVAFFLWTEAALAQRLAKMRLGLPL